MIWNLILWTIVVIIHYSSCNDTCIIKMEKGKKDEEAYRSMDQEASSPTPYCVPHRKRSSSLAVKFIKYSVYLFILLCCYSLGFLSSTFISTSPTPNKLAVEQVDDHNSFTNVCRATPLAPNEVRKLIHDWVFRGTSPWEGFPPSYIVPFIRPHRINGWGSDGAVFENLIREVKPKLIIEVGTFLGASALHMVNLTRKYGLKDTQILCIDDFRGWPEFQTNFEDMNIVNGNMLLMEQFMQNVVYSGATDSIIMMPFSSGSSLEMLCSWGVYGDLVEVDAGHDFHYAWTDINRAYKLLSPGGVLFGHDYFAPLDDYGVRRAVHLFAQIKNLTIQIDGQHWIIRPHPILST